jgi:hypothetical protein
MAVRKVSVKTISVYGPGRQIEIRKGRNSRISDYLPGIPEDAGTSGY